MATELQPIIGCKKTNNGGVEGIPIEIKILAALRHLGRGEVWYTIKELCNDKVSIQTLSSFFVTFVSAMCDKYQDIMIHPPESETELESVLSHSAARGMSGCLGYMDGVHVHWDKCPPQWQQMCKGKNEYPTIG